MVAALVALLQYLPAAQRRRVYDAAGVLSALLTVVVLAFANADVFGVEVPSRWLAILTGATLLLTSLARANVGPAEDPAAR